MQSSFKYVEPDYVVIEGIPAAEMTIRAAPVSSEEEALAFSTPRWQNTL